MLITTRVVARSANVYFSLIDLDQVCYVFSIENADLTYLLKGYSRVSDGLGNMEIFDLFNTELTQLAEKMLGAGCRGNPIMITRQLLEQSLLHYL